ncbi:MAG: tRNA-dihydrouridine synthase [Bacilli bacterium]|jgi:tRNA-dihydrouridine synthase B|nr:tRNA-dihydrouridine synthase [Bacilli bacterium]
MKTFTVAGLEIKNRYVQAPLAGYSSFAMRELARFYGAGLTYTEMTSANAINYKNKKTDEMLPHQKERGPVALQLFGSQEDVILEAIKYINDHAVFDFLDFNLGCPARKVLRQKSGSYLLKDPDHLYELMRKIVLTSSHPVTAKIRLGYDKVNVKENVKALEAAGVCLIAIHGRTTLEGFVGPVHYDQIGEAKKMVQIPVIANGNINVENIDEVERITGADAFMFGREAIGNPKLFEDLINHEEGKEIREKILQEQVTCILRHLDLEIAEKGEKNACDVLRGVSCLYLKGMDNMRALKNQLVHCSSRSEYYNLLFPLLSLKAEEDK